MAPRHNLWCNTCGKRMHRGKGSLPQGKARCQQCRPGAGKTPCQACGIPSWGVRCRPCRDKVQRIRPDDDTRVSRRLREQAAPGLNQTQRKRLLSRWVRQCRSCAYCPSLATTVDHVIPLVRGGTNHEGNLVPCCKQCNSSKAARLVSEWRHGRQPARTVMTPSWAMKPKVVKPRRWAEQAPMFGVCAHCANLHERRSLYCSEQCRYRANYVPRQAREGPCDCGNAVMSPRRKCDACRLMVERAAKARARKRWKQTEAGRASRRRHQARRDARRRAQRVGAGGQTRPSTAA